PTPSAVLKALALLSRGQGKNSGIGDLLAVDLGGATTDVYSIAKGDPTNPTTVLRGLPEPVIKRTVEGDLGMRYNALGVLEAAGVQKLAELSGLNTQEVQSRIEQYHKDPALLPQGQRDLALDTALAAAATGIALSRHAGTLERVYTPVGPVYQQTGKDLSQTEQMIVTGGALIYASNLNAIISGALSMQDPMVLAPRQVRLAVDREYVLSAMGLLADYDQRIALCLLMEYFGREEAYAVV
ncbi:MAG TPA: glutamate mutase L, partial [Clostridia bacterium]|nr:glutamate mutase L [Clostridia bacterium]